MRSVKQTAAAAFVSACNRFCVAATAAWHGSWPKCSSRWSRVFWCTSDFSPYCSAGNRGKPSAWRSKISSTLSTPVMRPEGLSTRGDFLILNGISV
uniref:Uncharacterized protein n=1 Tax=Anopheles atroparvus TaxID=41427 RepID=A0AAG5DUD9_ANOAO